MPGYDSELDRFKRDVNLTEFAAARGYVLDRRESSRNSAVMRHRDGDKLFVKTYSKLFTHFALR